MYEHARQENFRVGGVGDLSSGMKLNRNNSNATATHRHRSAGGALNQLSVQVGRRQFTEPNNSQAIAEYFSSGNTLQTGANWSATRTTPTTSSRSATPSSSGFGTGRWAQDVKAGGAVQYVKRRWNFPVYPRGLLIYLTDTRLVPLVYVGTSGTTDDTVTNDAGVGFAQTSCGRPRACR